MRRLSWHIAVGTASLLACFATRLLAEDASDKLTVNDEFQILPVPTTLRVPAMRLGDIRSSWSFGTRRRPSQT